MLYNVSWLTCRDGHCFTAVTSDLPQACPSISPESNLPFTALWESHWQVHVPGAILKLISSLWCLWSAPAVCHQEAHLAISKMQQLKNTFISGKMWVMFNYFCFSVLLLDGKTVKCYKRLILLIIRGLITGKGVMKWDSPSDVFHRFTLNSLVWLY